MRGVVQAAKNFKKRKSGSKMPSLPRTRSLSVPSDAAPAVQAADADGEAPRWAPLRMFNRGGAPDNRTGDVRAQEADKQESA